MRRLSIDPTLLEAVRAPQVFTQIDLELRPRLDVMPEVLDRIEGCVHFCFLTNSGGIRDKDASPKSRQKFLRAALCEFASLGDAAKLDFASQEKQVPGLQQLTHPQIHVVRLLRHANVHLATSVLTKESRPAIWPSPDGEVSFEHTHYVIENLNSTVRKTNHSNAYKRADLSLMIQWLEDQQREWGIANAVHRVAELYATILFDHWDDG